MRFNRTLGLTLVAAALMTAYGCGKEEPKKTAEAPAATPAAPAAPGVVVKIGHVGPTTGPQAHLGKDNENGARLAIDDANAKGIMIDGKKVKFELVAEDDQADPKQGVIVAQKLVDTKVAGVVGHLNSGTTIPAS
jgi:branched-chain amino acid transport system substrate-binding protein